jgi:hypothetical protein
MNKKYLFSSFCKIKLNYISDSEDFNHQVQQGEMCVTMIDDIERNDYCFTDGNGLISKGLARLIAERLKYLVKTEQKVYFLFYNHPFFF